MKLGLFGSFFGSPHDARMIFEYYAMAKPSKEGLAKELARKNETLHESWREWLPLDREWQAHRERVAALPPPRTLREPPPYPPALYGPRGTTDWQTMLQHIKRVFRKYKETCATISELPIEKRERFRQAIDRDCQITIAAAIHEGMSGRRQRGRGTKQTRKMSRDIS